VEEGRTWCSRQKVQHTEKRCCLDNSQFLFGTCYGHFTCLWAFFLEDGSSTEHTHMASPGFRLRLRDWCTWEELIRQLWAMPLSLGSQIVHPSEKKRPWSSQDTFSWTPAAKGCRHTSVLLRSNVRKPWGCTPQTSFHTSSMAPKLAVISPCSSLASFSCSIPYEHIGILLPGAQTAGPCTNHSILGTMPTRCRVERESSGCQGLICQVKELRQCDQLSVSPWAGNNVIRQTLYTIGTWSVQCMDTHPWKGLLIFCYILEILNDIFKNSLHIASVH
jgi:hypothetical protein